MPNGPLITEPLTQITDAELRLVAATLEVNLERAEAKFRADPTDDNRALWEFAQSEMRTARQFWRSIREVVTGQAGLGIAPTTTVGD